MNRQFFFALCLVLFLVAFAFDTSTFAQKGRRQSGKRSAITNPRMEPVLNAVPDLKAEALRVVNEQIQKLCLALERTMIDANSTYSKPPFDILTPAVDFQTTCNANGTVAWTAARNGGYGGDPSNTQNTIQVKFKAADLTLGDLTSKHGVVTFGSNGKKIHVYGPTTISDVAANADTDVAQWWIDLRVEGDLAKQFKESIRTLVEKLGERSKLID